MSVSEHSVQTTGAEAYGKAVWFCHPWLVSSWRRLFESNRVRAAVNPAAMEAKGSTSPGRARYKPSNHCAGNAGLLRLYLYARVRISLHLAHETAGASRRPAFPAPSGFRRDKVHANLGRGALRDGEGVSTSLRGAKRRSNPCSPRMRKDGLLRFARNDDLSIRNNSQQIAPANEWQLRLRLSALILNTPLLNRRP